ncbi:transcription termination factor NusA [Candidatus Acetothermia bacterium]|nr:transcription termination factor NusA [Candidatus Acetothermia bacterium]MBI3643547.1 transcription termination factor NusA [Candidatus Acetothermia bacterium]
MNVEFLEALEEMAKEEGIERDELYEAVNKGLAIAYMEEFGEAKDLQVEIDRTSGDIKITADGNTIELDLSKLGRIATRRAEETIRQEIVKRRRLMIYQRFQTRIGEIINGSIHRFEGRSVWINLGQAEALLGEDDRIPGEHYRPGQMVRTYLYDVKETQGDPRIYVSRSHKNFVKKLLELEVPEIEKRLVEVVAIAREAGIRTKLAVRSLVPEIEPVGTCVGAAGSRVREVVKELSGEKIDIIRWSEDVRELIKNSLEPASVLQIDLDPERKKAVVLIPHDELSLAIGKGGQNVRLTAKLTEWSIDVTSPEELKQKNKSSSTSEEPEKN